MLIEALPLVSVFKSKLHHKVETKETSATKVFLPDFSSIEVIIPRRP
ncbi:MAG: hypothetical protein J6O88_10110 [Chryseobacterium sp.]|nr:hypothetical protein [Chryseobacterium sp.]MBO6185020.1 hypothetical protein [Chryseobacterium sp.]